MFRPFELQREFRKFATSIDWADRFAATLTLKQARFVMSDSGRPIRVPLTTERASQNFRHFLNLLTKAVLGPSGRRLGKRIRAIPVLEGDQHVRMHYHALIECPRNDLISEFPELISQCWQRTDWGYKQVHVTSDPDDGWLRYMTKLRSKPDFASSIDWMNYAH